MVVHYLVRHGEAKSELEDPLRSLTETGKKEILAMAKAMEKKKFPLHKIFHSDKVRARETAEILGQALHPVEGLELGENLSPGDNPSSWAECLAGEKNPCMIVGHLPFLSLLAAQLLRQSGTASPLFLTGTCAALRKENDVFVLEWVLHTKQAMEEKQE